MSSHHHQAVTTIGQGMVVVATAADGTVEGIELADHNTWAVGVQWHPEDTADADPVQQRLFDTFVDACASVNASRDPRHRVG